LAGALLDFSRKPKKVAEITKKIAIFRWNLLKAS
jgi:hypothetical protein